jgi:hypothetical protein
VNDSAVRVSAIWISFVAFSAYLAAAASNILHRQIFLEEPIKLPTINIDLPLFASALLLPILFVIYHVYVLLQVVLLARTATAYNEAVAHTGLNADDQGRLRQQLPNTLFAQLFAGSPSERGGFVGLLLRLMAWVTLAIAPVLVLLVFEIKLLPYHDRVVTWTHPDPDRHRPPGSSATLGRRARCEKGNQLEGLAVPPKIQFGRRSFLSGGLRSAELPWRDPCGMDSLFCNRVSRPERP